jgi:hypothetical protein
MPPLAPQSAPRVVSADGADVLEDEPTREEHAGSDQDPREHAMPDERDPSHAERGGSDREQSLHLLAHASER